jgi:NAD(P)-dependent dehydrogenase (short-subunit alcohol dehydrogenase family)
MRRIAVITGVGSGVGKATADMLLEAKYDVIGIDFGYGGFSVDKFKQFLTNHNDGSMLKVGLDVTDEPNVLHFWTALEAAVNIRKDDNKPPLGQVDLLVNCAGISLMQWSEQIDMDEFRKVLDVNVLGSFSMATSFFRAFYGGDYDNVMELASEEPVRRVVNLKGRAK